MATRIIIKNSNVAGKAPAAGDLEAAELALNLKDQKLYSKDADGNVFELSGGGDAQVPGGDNPPGSGNQVGDLFFDTSTNTLLYWDGSQWVPIAGDEALALDDLSDVVVAGATDGQVLAYNGTNWVPVSPASLAVDVDLGYTAAADGGTVTNTAGDDASIPMANGTTAGLSLNDFTDADKTKLDDIDLTDYLQKGDNVSELTNDAEYVAKGDNVSDLVNDAGYLTEVPVNPPGDTEPGTPSHGDIWVDTSECPPVLKIYVDDAECPGEGGWQEIEGGTPSPVEPEPGDGNNGITPTPPGSGTDVDPYVLTAKTVNYGGTVQTDETISFSNQKPGAPVIFVDENAATNGTRYSQSAGAIGPDGTWSGKLTFTDTPDSTADTTFTGLLKIGTSSIYYSWNVTAEAAVIPPPVITQNPVISSDSDETEDPITVDTRAAVTNATFTSSAWLKDGAVIPGATSTSSYTPTAAGTYKFREVFTGNDASTVNADSNSLIITEKPDDPTKPNATMSGLRFDGDRETKLFRSGGDATVWTLSAWVKSTGHRNAGYILGDSDKVGVYLSESDNTLTIRDGTNNFPLSNALPDNEWVHIVVSYDNSGTVLSHINGVTQTAFSRVVTPGNFTSYTVGNYPSRVNYLGGYLSETYFVEEALEPTYFGKSFGGKWGPLDSAVVLENIKGKTKSPYSERPNMDQKWSDYAVSNGLEPWTKAFDGVISTSFNTNEATSNIDETPIVWTHTGTKPAFTKLEVWANRDYLSEPSSGKITINSFDVSDQIAGNTPAWYEIDLTGASNTTTLESITLAGYNTATSGQSNGVMRLGGVRLDGRILVDGPADNSQNWSSSYTYSTNNNNPGAPIPLTRLFNGSLERPGLDGYQNTINTWTFNPIDISGKTVELYGFKEGVGSLPPAINGVSIDNFSTHGVLEWIDVTSKFTNAGVTSISEIVHNVGTQGPEIVAIKLDGAILVDAGAQWDQSQVWSDNAISSLSPARPVTNIFDGNTATSYAQTDGSNDSTLTLNFGGINCTSLRVKGAGAGANGGGTISVNDTTGTTPIPGGVKDWIDLPVPSTNTLNDITFNIQKVSGGTDGGLVLFEVEVDGKLLVDAGTLGDNGFYLPFDPAQTGVTYSSGGSANFTPSDVKEGWQGMFDGNEATRLYVNTSSDAQTFTVTFTPALTNVTSLTQLCSGPNGKITANGNTTIVSPSADSWTNRTERNILSTLEGSTTLSSLTYTAGSVDASFGNLKVNGELLVDHSSIGADASGNGNHFQDENFILTGAGQDTVLDTPMKNYAVFDSSNSGGATISNGGLVTSSTSNTQKPAASLGTVANGKYYWEAKIDNRGTGNSFFGVTSTEVNFLVKIYGDPGKGQLMIQDRTGNNGGDQTINDWFSETVSGSGDTLSVELDLDGQTFKLFRNNVEGGVYQGTKLNKTAEYKPTFYTSSGTAAATWNFGQQPFTYSLPAGYEGLYQTWEQYARTALGYALDRIAKLEQQRTSDLATIAELRTRVEEALARIGSIETNEVDDDAVDTVLLTTVADLIERVEALEGA